jgi:LDH2 family malate/lactate/ureidoglycolate dehydrogenase
MQATEAGMIGFVCSSSPGLAPPTGGLTRAFGTNPLAYGVPAGEHFPFIVDFATTATALGKILIAKERGENIEEGLAMHPDGKPMTDPKEMDPASTLMLPMAGPKGYGLMMMVDILSGVVTGSGFGMDLNVGKLFSTGDMKHMRTGNFMWVIDPAQFMPREEFLARMDRYIEQIKGGKRMEGVDEIFIPGERGMRQKAASLNTGVIELEDATWAKMAAATEENGVSLPIPVG